MELESVPQRGVKALVVSVASVGIAWQGLIVALAFRYAPKLNQLSAGLGAPLPPTSRGLLATYRFWPLIPVVSLLLVTYGVTRPAPIRVLARFVAFVLLVGLVLQIWMNEALLAPVFDAIEKLG